VHELNHRLTQHLHCDVREVDPVRVLPGRKIGYLHLSPDCTDFSKAKGGKPKRKHIRALADVGLVWAGEAPAGRADPRERRGVQRLGPLDRHGQPDKARRGEEFRRWISELQALGLPGRASRAPRVRLRNTDDAQTTVRHRAVRWQADRLAGENTWQMRPSK
jgi:DNA (cytosine-5)-methyltransferase 1